VREIPYALHSMCFPQTEKQLKRELGLSQMPAVQLADGSWMTDSTKMIQWFEAEHEGPGLIPDDPVQAFLCLLLAGGQINAGTISNH
jgi:glutathione S-transferase